MGAPARVELPQIPNGCMPIIGKIQKANDFLRGRGSLDDIKSGKARGLIPAAKESLVSSTADELVRNILLPIVEEKGTLTEVIQKRVIALAGAWLGEGKRGVKRDSQIDSDGRRQQLLTALAEFPCEVWRPPQGMNIRSASSQRDSHLTDMIECLFSSEDLLGYLRNSRDSFLPSQTDYGSERAVGRITHALWRKVNSERSKRKAVLEEAQEREEIRNIFLPFLASPYIGWDAKRYMSYMVLDQTPRQQDSEIPDIFFWYAMGGFALSEEDSKRVDDRFSSGTTDNFLLKRIALTSLSGEKGQDYLWHRLGKIIASRGDMKFLLPLAYRFVPGVKIDPTIGSGFCIALNGILIHEANKKERYKVIDINQATQLAVAAIELCVRVDNRESGVWHDQQEMIKLLRTLHEMYPRVMPEEERVWNLMEYFLRSAHHEDLEKELAYFRGIIFRDMSVPTIESEQPDRSDVYPDIIALSFQLDEPQLEESAGERILQLIASADDGLTADSINGWGVLTASVITPSGRVEFIPPLVQRLQEFSGQVDQLSDRDIYSAGLICGAIGELVQHNLIDSRRVISGKDTVKFISNVLTLYKRKHANTVETTIRMLGLIHTLLGAHPEVSGNDEFCKNILQAFPEEPDTAHGIDGFSEADLIGYIRHSIEFYRRKEAGSMGLQSVGSDIE